MDSAARSPALAVARPVIVVLTWINGLYAAAIFGLLVATLVSPTLMFRALAGLAGGETWQVQWSLRAVVIVGLAGAFVAHRVLRHLLAIVDTVRDGDPFVAGNARRLQAIAWWVLAGEGLRLVVAALAWNAARFLPTLKMDVDAFAVTPWLAVLLLFVLAQVFAEGARMRADLEGTV